MIMQLALTQVQTPRTLTLTGATPAALQTAIDADTNTLNKNLRVPAVHTLSNGVATLYASGNVVNASISVSDTRVYVISNVPTYYAIVSWQEWVTPS